MNDFLPDGYEVPVSSGNYMKFEKGDNLFRVLSSAVVGYEYWNHQNKPVRVTKKPESMPADIRLDEEGEVKIKHFWAFIVWNYKAGKIQVLELTQATIQSAIENLVRDTDWGDPKGYDIKVTRTGEKLETEYTVSPKPHMPVKPEIASALASTPFDLKNLFKGEDVFDVRTSDGRPMPKF